MKTLSISRAGRPDIPLIAEYRFQMFADMFPEKDYSGIRKEYLAAVEKYYTNRFDNPEELTLFARAGDEPVGCGSIIFQSRPPSPNSSSTLLGYILNIYVRPEYRRMGVATGIMQALQAEAKERGVKRFALHASKAGACVYAKLGYAAKENYMECSMPE